MTTPPVPGADPAEQRQPSLERHDAFVAAVAAECGIPGSQQALRRALGKPVDGVPARTHAVLLRNGILPDGAGGDARRAHYAVAALIADLPRAEISALLPDRPSESPADPDGRDESGGPSRRTFKPGGTNLGESLARAAIVRNPDIITRDSGTEAAGVAGLEARLHLMVRQDPEGLHRMLPGVLRQVVSTDTPVDYACLLRDLSAWRWHRDSVATRWLTDHYRTINRERAAVKARKRNPAQPSSTRP
ncbi:type I-E CRISPR-associated protein Cse2/CasB [Streptomyces sp. NPDC003691]